MPAEQGVGANEEAGPCRARHSPAEAGEEAAVGSTPLWLRHLTLKNMQLVAQDEQLHPERRIGPS